MLEICPKWDKKCPKIKFLQEIFIFFFYLTSLYVVNENSAQEKLLDSFENVVWITILFFFKDMHFTKG